MEEHGKTQALLEVQGREVEKAKIQIDDLRGQHVVQLGKYSQLQVERENDTIRFNTQIRRIQAEKESSKRAALKEPSRYGRVSTYYLRRGMRQVCRSSGGTVDECKINIPKPTKAYSSPTVQSDPADDDRVGAGDK